MSFSRYIAFSIVASSVLCGATAYNDWTNTTLTTGDTVTIDYGTAVNPPATAPTPLSKSLTINGNATASITGDLTTAGACGYVACWNSSASLGGNGTLTFTLNAPTTNSLSGFVIQNGTLTTNAGITVNGAGLPSTIFEAQNGASLVFNGDLTISGNVNTTAIKTGTGSLTLGNNGSKTVNITGNLDLGGSATINLKSGSKITGNITSANTQTLTLANGSSITGDITQTGGNSFSLTMTGGSIGGKVTASSNGTNTISLSNNASIGNGLETQGGTNNLTINQSNITGSVSLTGSNTTSLTKATINGDLILNGNNQGNIAINNSTITGTVGTNQDANFGTITGSTIGSMTHTSGTLTAILNNSTITNGINATSNGRNISLTLKQNSHINGTSSLNAGTGTNSITLNNSSTVGDITLSSSSTSTTANIVKTYNNATIQSLTTSNSGGLSFLLANDSQVTNGIKTSAQSTKVDIASIDNSHINGTSELKGADEVRVIFKSKAGAGTLKFYGTTNNLVSRESATTSITAVTMQNTGTNQVLTENNATLTIGSLSMTGQINDIAETSAGGTNLANDGANLTITGNASATTTAGGHNKLAFGKGSITGSLTTQGETDIYMLNDYQIKNGIIHSNGNFNTTLYSTSQISNGIQTNGTGTTNINLKNNSKLNGNSTLATDTNTITLIDASSINGNTTFSGTANSLTLDNTSKIVGNTSFSNTSTLTANDGTSITGQIFTSGGNADYNFGNNGGGNTGATVTGGITTQVGAISTKADFIGNSILQNGTSNFHSNIDITFANNSKADNEQFNVNAGTANITFKDDATMTGGAITTNGGISNIKFLNNAKMVDATVSTTGGTANLTASSNAEISNAFTQSGGTFNATFLDSAKFNGNGTQSGGTSNIQFKNQSTWTGNFNQSGANSNSTITFSDTASMTGNIITTDGITNITFNNGTRITGDIKAQGIENKVTFTSAILQGNLTLDGLGGNINGDSIANFKDSAVTGNIQGYDKVDIEINHTQVDGFLHQGGSYHTQGMKATITNGSTIKGGFQGIGSSNNTLTITDSTINNGVKQSTGTLKVTASEATITEGFEGTSNSQNTLDMIKGSLEGGITQNTGSINFTSDQTTVTGGFHGSVDSTNTVTMTEGSLEGGIEQDTGSLDFTSKNTSISGGFTGTSSTNTLKMAGGNFNSGDIRQTNGSLKAEILNITNLQDFIGTSSDNIVQLSNTQSRNISQNDGSLLFSTTANVTGYIQGTNNSDNQITITGANVAGTISQNMGSMSLTSTNANLNDAISSTNATFSLFATNTTGTSITLDNSSTTGVSDNLTLSGLFKQIGNKSTMTFADSHFTAQKSIELQSTTSASLIFTRSEIKGVSATLGISTLNLSNSTMENFTGDNGNHTIMLTTSTGGDFSQSAGKLSVSGAATSTINSLAGINNANITLNLNNASRVTQNVTNQNGTTSISMQDSTIGGNVEQTEKSLAFTANNSEVTGYYKQVGGSTSVNFSHSFIKGGVELEAVTAGSALTFSQESEVNQGFKATNSNISLSLLSKSKITEGFNQDGGTITGSLNSESSVGGNQANNAAGLSLSNGTTNFSLFNDSEINDGIKATNNNTTILIDHSQINGDITVKGNQLILTAQNNSTITSNQMSIEDADLTFTLDTTSKFIGDLTQTNNKQTINIKQNSEFQGNITNTNTNGTITINNASLTGSLTQKDGTLGLDLSNGGKIGQNVTLENATTTLSGTGINNQIGGNFSQSNGTLTGSMNGLTLGGTYSQNGGTSSVLFTNSAFNGDTTITDATSSLLTFDNSTLRNYTITGGTNNTLKLLNNSTMNGTLILGNGALAVLTMNDSTINGANNTAITGSDNSILTFDTQNSTVTGEVNFNTGGLAGTANDTDFRGNFTLTNTTSDVSFTNTSTITGDLTATGTNSNNTINFDNSSITGNVSQEGGTINLDLSNGSSIGRNLTFTNAIANLTGSGEGNRIEGKFDTTNTTLTGNISGLTLMGTFTQISGTSNIIFRDLSQFNSTTTIQDATSSNLQFINQSGITNAINIINGTDNMISLKGNSYIQGPINLQNTLATISALDQSSIVGNIQSNNSTSALTLSSSTFQGDITQDQGSMTIAGSNNSTLTTQTVNLTNTTLTQITLNSKSTMTGNITANNSNLVIALDDSSYGTENNLNTITLTNSSLAITASNSSTLNANIRDTNNNPTPPLKTANLAFSSNSNYNGEMEFSNIDLQASFVQSNITSPQISITSGSALFDFNNSNGIINTLNASDTTLTINTTNGGHITIAELKIAANSLSLHASDSARLTSSITLDDITTATYKAETNGNLNVDTNILNMASTLTADINGGVLQGSITQVQGANGFEVGDIILQSSGDNGGRWLITDDSQVKTLTINNLSNAIFSNAILSSPFDTPLSIVDFTTEKDDTQVQTRIGKAIIKKPEAINGQPIPPAPDGSTYVRQLHVNEIKGNNGLFRVYADLGSNLADNILANKASGDHLIQVYYRADTFREIGGDRIVVAKVTDGGSSVSFKGTESEIGVTRYNTEIIKENATDGNGFEWIIGQATPAGISYSSKIIASILQNQYRNFMVEIDSLDRRMGDLEFINRDKGLWFRSYIGSNTKEATDFSISAQDNYYSIWSGFDFNSIGLTVHNYAGVFFNYTGINTESKDYTAKSSNIAFGIYDTFKAFSGFYADILAKYIYTMSEFDISNYSLSKNSPKIDNHKFLLNAEIGYSFYYGEKGKSGYIQPQFQVTSGYIHKTSLDFIDASGENIEASIGRNFPVSIRTGAFWGQVFGEKFKSHIKLGTSIVYDVDSGGDITLQDSSDQLTFKQKGDLRWLLSAHADFTFNDFFKMYTSFDTSFFGNYNTTYSFNIGLRFTFGRSNNTVPNVPMVYSPYTPPVIINDDHRTVPVIKKYTTKDIDQNYVGKPRRIESYIQGNSDPTIQQGSPTYTPSRQPHRDITSEVEF